MANIVYALSRIRIPLVTFKFVHGIAKEIPTALAQKLRRHVMEELAFAATIVKETAILYDLGQIVREFILKTVKVIDVLLPSLEK